MASMEITSFLYLYLLSKKTIQHHFFMNFYFQIFAFYLFHHHSLYLLFVIVYHCFFFKLEKFPDISIKSPIATASITKC